MHALDGRQANETPDSRAALCKSLGLANEAAVYRLIVACVRKGVEGLLAKGLDARTLTRLGYDRAGMKKLGCTENDLQHLGYDAGPRAEPHAAPGRPQIAGETFKDQLEHLIAAGHGANELKSAGFTVHHCKAAGYDAREVERLGFTLSELAAEYTIHELKRVGFGVLDLRGLFSGSELRNAGFSATDMRIAGYTIKQLFSFGYSENQIRTAGFSNTELAREGLTRRTIDKSSLSDL
jgi:intracellular multiplication protein IcmE